MPFRDVCFRKRAEEQNEGFLGYSSYLGQLIGDSLPAEREALA